MCGDRTVGHFLGVRLEPGNSLLSHGRRAVDCGTVADGFDLVLHYYVMEHLADPVAFLKSQLGLLKPGGRIVFEVPNANDALTVLYEIPAYARFIWVVSHRWYFTEKSLAATIAKAGGQGEVRLDQRYDLSNHSSGRGMVGLEEWAGLHMRSARKSRTHTGRR